MMWVHKQMPPSWVDEGPKTQEQRRGMESGGLGIESWEQTMNAVSRRNAGFSFHWLYETKEARRLAKRFRETSYYYRKKYGVLDQAGDGHESDSETEGPP